MKIIFKWDN